MRYVIDSRYFDGSCLSSMCDDTHSDYGRETLQELRERERNPFLVAVSPEKILFLMRRYIRMLCTPFREITREDYYNLFECVPPARMGRNWFFVGEAYFGDLYPFCFTSDGHYFKGERPVHLKDEAIWSMIGEHMKTLDFHPELVHGEPQVESDRWYNGDITVTPYYFLRDGKRMFIGNLISDTGRAAEDSRHRREMAERLLDLRRNHYEYCTFYSHVKDLFGFFEWIRKNRYTLEIQGTLLYFDPARQYVDFMGNVCEYSAAFHYRLYSRGLLELLIGQLRAVKRNCSWKPTKNEK